MTNWSFEKAWFILSLGILVFLYGVAVGKWRWAPYYVLDQAADQARTVYRSWTSSPRVALYNQVHERSGVHTPRPKEVQSGLTLLMSSWKQNDEWGYGLKLVDETGDVVHERVIDVRKIFGGTWDQLFNPQLQGVNTRHLQGHSLLPNGDVLVNLPYVGMVRLDACGNVRWTLMEGNHHSITQAEDGSFWVPGVHPNRRAGSEQYPDGFPGFDGKKVWVDRILRVSDDGEILEDINVLDVLYANGLDRYIPKVLGGKRPKPQKIPEDLTHLNDVEPLSAAMADEYPLFEEGDLVVSLRGLSLVFVLNPETGKVKWHATDPFIYQHDPDFIGDGWIGVFDNNYDLTGSGRGTMLGGSRIVALQPHTDSMDIRFPTAQSEPFYTHIRGKWQKLENGNMLLTEAVAGRVVEVNPQGETVWEWVYSPTQNSKVPAVEGERYNIARETVASWPCSSVDSVNTSAQ